MVDCTPCYNNTDVDDSDVRGSDGGITDGFSKPKAWRSQLDVIEITDTKTDPLCRETVALCRFSESLTQHTQIVVVWVTFATLNRASLIVLNIITLGKTMKEASLLN